MCLSVLDGLKIGVLKCHNLGGNQAFMLTESNEIRKDTVCVTAKNDRFAVYEGCSKANTQKFAYNNQVVTLLIKLWFILIN